MRALIIVLMLALAGCTAPLAEDEGASGAGHDPGEARSGSPGVSPSGASAGQGDEPSQGAVGSGSASFYIQDAATDEFDKIHVVITKVEVHRAGDEQNGSAEEAMGQDPGNGTSDGGNETSGSGNETSGNETSGGGNETSGSGNETSGSGNETSGNETSGSGNETSGGGNETSGSGNETSGGGNETSGSGNETSGNETSGGSGQNATADGCTAAWLTISESNGTDVDLMAATGDLAFFLGEADLAACKYTQIRIHVSEAYGMIDGNRTEIDLSNGVLKIVHPFHVQAGEETQVIVDVDLDKSVKAVGGKGPNQGWRMTPVIGKAYDQQADDAESGADVHEEGEIAEV